MASARFKRSNSSSCCLSLLLCPLLTWLFFSTFSGSSATPLSSNLCFSKSASVFSLFNDSIDERSAPFRPCRRSLHSFRKALRSALCCRSKSSIIISTTKQKIDSHPSSSKPCAGHPNHEYSSIAGQGPAEWLRFPEFLLISRISTRNAGFPRLLQSSKCPYTLRRSDCLSPQLNSKQCNHHQPSARSCDLSTVTEFVLQPFFAF
mmetsp:Transcript_2759/g.3946  ORF Transcript_2759/g.3946 Transcript_2759/m.3946 type:complete len:205 (+) Transcript_2759:1750-2364(+)